jgi:nucleotide sugar dehydrogenase
MQIGIIGFGFVGSAVAHAHNNDVVLINDPKLKESTPLDKFVGCDAVYICVPSPTVNGVCDTSILESVLESFEVEDTVPIISKVTAPPGVYESLQKKYPNLVYAPEFLTERNNVRDYILSNFLIVGGNIDHVNVAIDIITSSIEVPEDEILITDIKTASFFKYFMNSYLATKVSFMNEFYNLAQAEDINWKQLKHLAEHDKRIGKTHMNVPGYDGYFGWGGSCFPKDVDAIINYAESKGVSFDFLKNVTQVNKQHRSRKDD